MIIDDFLLHDWFSFLGLPVSVIDNDDDMRLVWERRWLIGKYAWPRTDYKEHNGTGSASLPNNSQQSGLRRPNAS